MSRKGRKGFTLLEMLVVLSLIGLMAGIIAPDLMTMTDRIDFAMNREKFEHNIAALPYEAFRQKKDFLLSSTTDQDSADATVTTMSMRTVTSTLDNLITIPISVERASLVMPPNWTLKMETPILYRAAGYCSGGMIELHVGASIYQYELKAPDCHPIAK